MIEGVSMSLIALVISILGMPGAVLVLWYIDQRKIDRIMREHRQQFQEAAEDHRKELQKVLSQYREDVAKVTRFYEDNVLLVKGYERLAGDLTSIITLSTRTLEGLVQRIDQNQFCPMLRRGGSAA